MDRYDNMIVFFYSPGCIHCKQFKPLYHKAAEFLAQNYNQFGMKFGMVSNEGEDGKRLHADFGIVSVPDTYYFKKGLIANKYESGRDH